MLEPLAPSGPLDAVLRAALPVATDALRVRVVEGLRVLALRHLAAGIGVLEQVLTAHSVGPLAAPGEGGPGDPGLVWSRPGEFLLLTTDHPLAEGLLQALAPGRESMACALDQSAGTRVFELLGPGLADLLPRLFDAGAIPRQSGRATRTRMVDIAALVQRRSDDCAWLVVDSSHDLYTAQWLAYASNGDAAQ